jgi:hypothetical protein
MRAIEGDAERGPVVSVAFVLGSLAVLVLVVVADLPVVHLSVLVGALAAAAVSYRTALRWHSLLAGLIVVILFIPIKRYGLPGNLPFDLEPYRLMVLLIVAGWIVSLLVDPRVRLRKSGLEGPLGLIALSAFASVLVNGTRIDELRVEAEVVKGLMFLLSFLLVVYLIVSVIRSFEQINLLVKVIVAGGAFVAGAAVFEGWSGFNVFDHLAGWVPFLSVTDTTGMMSRGGRLRVNASAQGAIPLGAALVLLIPPAIYLARTSARRVLWRPCAAVVILGALATQSRTSVVMLLVVGLVFLWLRPRETRRTLGLLLVPMLLVVHVALPGTIGALHSAFFPEGGLIAQQSQNPGWRGSGRLADIGPAMEEFVAQPLLGQGYSTRITGRVNANAQILDDQWLKTLLETGVVGVCAWLWLFARFARRVGPRAKEDDGEEGWLLTALTASVLAFAVGMFFYDAFAFIQVTLLFYILTALGMAQLALPKRTRQPSRVARRVIRPPLPAPTARRGPILADRPSRDRLAPG